MQGLNNGNKLGYIQELNNMGYFCNYYIKLSLIKFIYLILI